MRHLSSTIRGLRKSPGIVVVAVLSLGLGIGSNVTVFSVVREMIFDDLSARRPEQLTRVEGADVSYTEYRNLRATGPFEELAYHRGLGDRVWRAQDANEIAWILTTSANFFDVLGVGASRGRLYSQADEGREVAVVSYGFWHRRLHDDAGKIGQSIQLNGKFFVVVGVLPRDYRSVFGHGVSPEIYLSDAGNTNPKDRLAVLFGRFSREQIRQSLRRDVEFRPMAGIAAAASKPGDERRFFLFFMILFIVAGSLMLIACSNVAGLLVARGLNRRRELGIRKALGANRLQLVRPLLAESIVLIACGAALALVFDSLVRDRLRFVRWPSAYGLPFEFHFQNDGGLLLYGSVLSLAALLLSALLPALRSADADITLAMKQGEPAFSVRRFDLRAAFVLLQIVLSIVLLSVGGLFTRSLQHLVARGPGFDVSHTLIAVAHSLPGRRSWELRQRVVRRVEAVPGVVSVTSTGTLPLMGELPEALLRREDEAVSGLHRVHSIGAGENYCGTLGITIVRGRDFAISDRDRQPIPVIVNRTLAEELFSDRDPIGQYLVSGTDRAEQLLVIGVAADAKMRTLGEGDVPAFFRPEFNGQLLVRVSGSPGEWIAPLRLALADVDPTAALDVRPLGDAASGALFPLRVASGFLGTFSVLGLVLALVGLYGSISYAVGRRTLEFGIRSALGASRANIVWVALRDGFAVLGCGVMIGLLLSLAAMRPLTDFVPDGVNPWALGPFFAVVLVLLATGFLASWIPALRAACAQPCVILRQE